MLYHVTSLPPVLLELPERGQLLEVRPTVHWHMLQATGLLYSFKFIWLVDSKDYSSFGVINFIWL